jgi:hypothetical protein
MADALAHSELRHLSDDEWEGMLFHLLGFREAAAWAGASKGWVFKTDWAGLGYYCDDGAAAGAALLRLATTCGALRERTRPYLKMLARYRLLTASRSCCCPHTSRSLGRFLAETGERAGSPSHYRPPRRCSRSPTAPPAAHTRARPIRAIAAGRAARSINGGVTARRLQERLASFEFVSDTVAAYYVQSRALASLARALESAMRFARAIGLAADAQTASHHGRQLVLAADDDVERAAKLVVQEAMLERALEHARMSLEL